MPRTSLVVLLALAAALTLVTRARAQEDPYFVTYSHQLEEAGNLEITWVPTFGTQRSGNDFLASWTEFEFGVKGWWTTEFYLEGQSTFRDSTILTGWRWENRFRPLMREHWINPVLYFEFEDVNAADKTFLEIVGHDSEADGAVSNALARRERQHEMETKLILSSNFKGWNASGNFISEKNLGAEPWEFGYALGLSRPLALAASPQPCNLCRENLAAGLELYGGLGTTHEFGLSDTSHYLAPLLSWDLPSGITLRISPGWGLTHTSHRFLLRFGVSYELEGVGRRIRTWFQ